MSIIRLLSAEMPDLLPMLDRSPGIHLSDIINDISISLGHYKPTPLNMARLQLGNAFEWALIERWLRHYPGRYARVGEMHRDGIYVTGDVFDKELWRPAEAKCTFQSAVHTPDEFRNKTGYLKYRWQACAQAKVMRSDSAVIPIVHPLGDYKAHREPLYREWEEQYSRKEINDNWNMLSRHRDEMIRSSERWRRIANGEDRATIDAEESNQ